MIRYPGGKAKLKKQICSRLICDDLQYREPFFGGGSIGLSLLPKNMWINDKDIGIACLWTAIIRYPEEFKNLINKFVPTVDGFYQFKTELLEISVMPQEKNEIINIGFKKLAIARPRNKNKKWRKYGKRDNMEKEIILQEIWKKIEGHERYSVSTFGRVRNDITGNLLNTLGAENTYVRISLMKNNKQKRFRVHRLVAQAFLPNPDQRPTVNHKNKNKSDNYVGNLEWSTIAAQNIHKNINKEKKEPSSYRERGVWRIDKFTDEK